MARTRARCPVCQRGPYQLGNLYDHLRFVHWWSKEKVDQLKLKIKNTKFEGRFGIECECGKIYYSQHGIRVHRERMHGVPLGRSANYFPVTCPACHSLFRTGEELAIHCDEKHRKQGGQDFSMIQGTFRTHDDFEEWIDSVERLTKVEFTKRTSRLCKDGRNHIFVCKHSRGKGAAVDPKEIRQRFKKSERVHSHCPAFIRVIENMDGSVSYRGCLGHLGHKVGLEKAEQNPKEKSKRWQTHRRHKDALLYYSSRLDSCVSELSDDTWAVQAEDGFEYTVVVGDPCECGEDNTHCDRCGACPYQIICNCSDVVQKKGVSCIHAHAIATFIDKAHQRIPSVQHYLATEMPGCSSASSEHDEGAPPLLDSSEDMGDSDDDEHYEDNLSREEKKKTITPELIHHPSWSCRKKPIPKAKEELEQFQGLDEKQHVMVNTCMQSHLPHVIRDIRSTIESKMSEILPAGVEKTPKTRLQNSSRFIQQEEAGPSTSSKQGECPSQQPNHSRENKIPATRKVLRREFLEARSSRIRLSDEDQKEVLRIRTQREQNQQVVAQPIRKVLKREFIEASTS
ncbi:zinc finger, C2H2 type, partial [Necator americanus]